MGACGVVLGGGRSGSRGGAVFGGSVFGLDFDGGGGGGGIKEVAFGLPSGRSAPLPDVFAGAGFAVFAVVPATVVADLFSLD